MKVGFDAKRLFLNNTGLGNYSRTLVRNLSTEFPDIDIYLFTPKATKSPMNIDFFDESKYTIVTSKGSLLDAQWRRKGIVNQIDELNLDIYHGLSNELPVKKSSCAKYVVTIHDVIFKEYPQQYKLIDRKIYESKTEQALTIADVVLSISDATTYDIRKYFPNLNIAIKKLYQTCGWSFVGNVESNKAYFLYVSSITERKNLKTILKAFHLINDKSMQLIVIGSGGKYKQECIAYINEHGLKEQVLFIGDVTNAQLKQYYIDAIALIYPSLKEGFGIPIIEAIASGSHVITSGGSSMPEAGGALAKYTANPNDPAELANLISTIKHEPNLSAIEIQQHLSQFNPRKLTQQLVEIYRELL